jgi:hypothetical protein
MIFLATWKLGFEQGNYMVWEGCYLHDLLLVFLKSAKDRFLE